MSRSIEEILGGAREELEQREARLHEIATRAKSELDEVRRAIKRLGKRPSRNGGSPSKPSTSPDEAAKLTEEILGVLDRSLDPPTASQIAEEVQTVTTPQGVAMKLRHMEKAGLVQRIGANTWGKPSPIGSDDE